MPRIRSLKPELWQDEAVGALSKEARLLFIGLITQADDDGRLVGAPRLLWSQIYPWDNFDPNLLEAWMGELTEGELVQAYLADGRDYLALAGWKSHQKISHPTPSKLPKPPKVRRKAPVSLVKSPEDSGRPPEENGDVPEASSLARARIGKDLIGEDQKGSNDPPTPQRGAA